MPKTNTQGKFKYVEIFRKIDQKQIIMDSNRIYLT